MSYSNFGCYILAGGQNKRMGVNKSFLCVGETTVIGRQLVILTKIFPRITIVTNDLLTYQKCACEIIPDDIPGLGPLGGILTALKSSSHNSNFFLACDMPFLNSNLIEYILQESNNSDITVIRDGEYLEPLLGVYSKRCIPAVENFLQSGGKKVTGFYKAAGLVVHEILAEKARRIDSNLASLININTRHDFEYAVKLAQEK